MPEQVPSRRGAARLGAVVLGSQAVVLVFAAVAARAVTLVTQPQSAGVVFAAGIGLTALAALSAAAMRTRSGVALGWLTQVLTFAYARAVPMMLVAGVIFTGLWIVALHQGRKMDALTSAYLAARDGRAGPSGSGQES